MDSNVRNILVVGSFLIIAWTLTCLSTRFRPHRFRNCFYLAFTLGATLIGISLVCGDYIGTVMLGILLGVAVILLLVPGMLIYNGVVMIKKESMALGHVLSLILGALLAIGEMCYIGSIVFTAMELYEHRILVSVVFYIGSIAFFFGCIMLSFVLYMIFLQVFPHRSRFRYIIIHGCGLNGEKPSRILQDRIDKAIAIYHKCAVKPMIIPSGGRGEDEVISEAEAMSRYMLKKGVAPEHILKEEVSTTTMENLIESKKVIQQHAGADHMPKHRSEIALVSSNYHIYRCLTYAQSLKMKCTGFGSRVAMYYWPSAVIREFVAVITKKKNLIFCVIFFILYLIQCSVMLTNMW